MNRITSSFFASWSNTAFARSSNSPRYFVPATIDVTSSDHTFLFFRISGQSSLIIFRARPSAIAVLPTPGSPTIITLFFLRLARTSVSSINSSSRPMIGSIFPSAADLFKFSQKSSNFTGAPCPCC